MVRRGGSAPPASAMSVRRSASDLPARECRVLCAAMSGGPGWIRTINLPIQSRALCWLSYRATIRQPELHRSLADTSGVRRYQRFGGIEMVGHLGAAPSVSPI